MINRMYTVDDVDVQIARIYGLQQPGILHGGREIQNKMVEKHDQHGHHERPVGQRKTEDVQQLRLIGALQIDRLFGLLQEINVQEAQTEGHITQNRDQIQLVIGMESVGDDAGDDQHHRRGHIADHLGGGEIVHAHIRGDVGHVPGRVAVEQEVDHIGKENNDHQAHYTAGIAVDDQRQQ